MLIDQNETAASGYTGAKILLYPFRNLSLHPFSYPFSGTSRVREALKIQFKPLLGEGAEHVSIIPFFVGREKKSSSGCVFLLFGDETRQIEEGLTKGDDQYLVWPAVMAFAGEVQGNGLILWSDDRTITTLWLENWVPMFYKTSDADKTSLEEEERVALDYIAKQGHIAPQVLLFDRRDVTDADAQACGTKTLADCPAYEQLDLSSKGTNLLEQREKTIGFLSRFGKIAIATGMLALIATGTLFLQHKSLAERSAGNAESVYSASFGERSGQPLASASTKLRSVRQTTEADVSLHAVMRSITKTWDNLGASDDIAIESLKYGTENTDILGTALDNESIQNLRQRLEDAGYTPKTDNIQKIPSGELRFNMSLSRSGKQ